MVSLEIIRASNALIGQQLPAKLVAVFIGATAGIGEGTIKEFARNANAPRIYFVGRSQANGDRLLAELKAINPEGDYTFISSDVSLIKNVDDVCRQLKEKEKSINMLFMTCGTLHFGTETTEGLHYATALGYYSRQRFALNLLPEIRRATGPRRVITTLVGALEGPVDTNDIPGYKVPLTRMRNHTASVLTLGLERIAAEAPDVTFIHNFPGSVDTRIIDAVPGVVAAGLSLFTRLFGRFLSMTIQEAGERHTFLLTSARYLPAKVRTGESAGVVLPLEQREAKAVTGTRGLPAEGMYSLDGEGEASGPDGQNVKALKGLREDGTADKIWEHTMEEFVRITGQKSL